MTTRGKEARLELMTTTWTAIGEEFVRVIVIEDERVRMSALEVHSNRFRERARARLQRRVLAVRASVFVYVAARQWAWAWPWRRQVLILMKLALRAVRAERPF